MVRRLFALVALLSFSARPAVAAPAATNLVRNPSFETGGPAFEWVRMESPRVRVKAKEDPRYVSRPDARHVREGARAWLFRSENPEGRNNVVFTNLPVTAGRRYLFRAHYYLDEAEGPTMVWGNRHERDAAGKTSGYRNLSQFDTVCGRWNEFRCLFYAAPKSATADVEIIFGGKMSVWLDDVSFTEDAEPPPAPSVGAKILETAAFSAAWLSPLTKALPAGVPSDLAAGDGAVPLDAAKGERESFQLVLGAKRALAGVTVTTGEFVREGEGAGKIGADAVTVREVKFVPIANAKNPRMNRLHPDPVVPFARGAASAGSNLVALVTVKVPRTASAGVYAGAVTVAAEGVPPVAVPLRLTVRDFALPGVARLKSYFYFNPNYGGGAYKTFDARPEPAIWADALGLYRELRLAGNQAMVRPEPKWEIREGHVVVTDWSPYDDEVARLMRDYNLSVFPVPFVGMLGDNHGWFRGGRGETKSWTGTRTVGTGPKATPFGGFFDEPVGARRVIEALARFAEHAKERFPSAEFVWYFYDEPPYAVMDVLPQLLKTYEEALEGIRILVVATPLADRFAHYGIRVAGFSPSSVRPRIRNFDETWYYQYPATIEDEDYLRNRFFPWQVYRADGRGVLLWNTIWYGNRRKGAHDPWTELTALSDGAVPTVFYPPRPGTDEGLVPSLRAINIGDAIEDYDYLKLYEGKFGKEAASALVRTVLPEATDLPADPRPFLALRRSIAEELQNRE